MTDGGCGSNAVGGGINVLSKSKVQVWQISMCLLEMDSQSKAIVLDGKQEKKLNGFVDMSLKGRGSIGRHQ